MAERALKSIDAGAVVEQLSALLAFDRHAAESYGVASERLRSESLRRSARHFREDHERHIDELSRLLRAYGGPRPPAAETAAPDADSSAETPLGSLASDRAILRALKTSERRGRDAYRLAAKQAFPAEVAAVLRRASNDETTHYAWALEMLDDLDLDRGPLRRTVGVALDEGGARFTGFVEVVERRSNSAVGRLREGVSAQVGAHPLRAALVALGVGLCVATLGGGRDGRDGAIGALEPGLA